MGILNEVERVKSGIIGLDEKVEGGFVKGSVNLISGKTGTGKTAFCMSFIYEGAKNFEPGVYVTTEERVEDIKKDIEAMFNWDIDSFERQGLIKFLSIRPFLPSKSFSDDEIARLVRMYIFNLSRNIEESIRFVNAKRLVIDSISLIEAFIKDKYIAKVALMQLIDKLKEYGVTVLITGTIPEESTALTGEGMLEFIVDCVIKLDFVPVAEEFKRTLTIRKMRRTNHSTFIHPFDITREGIKLLEI
ncbi:MAG: ATPase [Candidatus Aenigmatarchaeota archaeon]|nr:MAG: ATPase [Candidatus Aenigmarchaeota archaeon]